MQPLPQNGSMDVIRGDRRSLCFLLSALVLFMPSSLEGQSPSARAPMPGVLASSGNGTLALYAFDAREGRLSLRARVSTGEPLSFVQASEDGRRIYAVGRKRLLVYTLKASTLELELVAERDLPAAGTHLEWDRLRGRLWIASYGGHRVFGFELDADGLPGPVAFDLLDPKALRNAHQVRIHPTRDEILVPCLGADQISVLGLLGSPKQLSLLSSCALDPKSGPRHLDFHRSLPTIYVLNELSSTVDILEYGAADGIIRRRVTVEGVPQPKGEGSRSSDIHVSKDGAFVSIIHREPRDEIVVFRVEPDGDLKLHDRVPTGGNHARVMLPFADGKSLLLANRNSEDLSVFHRGDDGHLVLAGVVPSEGPVMSLSELRWPGASPQTTVTDTEAQEGPTVRVMSYNVRYGTAKDGVHHWTHRGDDLLGLIADGKPDVLGVQEALKFQLLAIGKVLPHHQILGKDRKGGDGDEHSSLLVDERKFEVLKHGQFWLGDDPDSREPQHDAALPRIAVWAEIRERVTQRSLFVMNTHFDHQGRKAREASAAQLAKFVESQTLPTLIMGDFNANERDVPHRVFLRAGFRDTFRVVYPVDREIDTFTNFERRLPLGKIDAIYFRGPLQVSDAAIVSEQRNGRFPSDHLAASATLVLR
ncbi:MAG TPA: beta-propeller fold lactonase family protein [Planctomycetota bacterium]|nr:beta-propeller fold lactonase family protein [Planctomycetota bacterium]